MTKTELFNKHDQTTSPAREQAFFSHQSPYNSLNKNDEPPIGYGDY